MLPLSKFSLRRALAEVIMAAPRKADVIGNFFSEVDTWKHTACSALASQDISNEDVATSLHAYWLDVQRALKREDRDALLSGFVAKSMTNEVMSYMTEVYRNEAKVGDVMKFPCTFVEPASKIAIHSIYGRQDEDTLSKFEVSERQKAANGVMCVGNKFGRVAAALTARIAAAKAAQAAKKKKSKNKKPANCPKKKKR